MHQLETPTPASELVRTALIGRIAMVDPKDGTARAALSAQLGVDFGMADLNLIQALAKGKTWGQQKEFPKSFFRALKISLAQALDALEHSRREALDRISRLQAAKAKSERENAELADTITQLSAAYEKLQARLQAAEAELARRTDDQRPCTFGRALRALFARRREG